VEPTVSVSDDTRTGGSIVPRVSIAIPVYNGEKYLTETIATILSQTFQDFEFIICDNASTDRTQEICESFEQLDERVHYYRSENNVGWAGNFNKAVDLARGEYFKWAAHDDLLSPNFIEKCVQILDTHKSVVLCYPQTLFINENSEPLGVYADQLHLCQPTAHERFRDFFQHQSLSHPVFGVARRDVLLQTQRMGSYVMSDRVWIGEMALHGQIFEYPEALFLRRIHDEISTNINESGVQMLSWINPQKKAKVILPKWRRLIEYFKAINRTRMGLGERIACYFVLCKFLLIRDRWSGLLGEIIRVVVRPKNMSWMK
jgi:glycosyltransferase involved in cell wall biosynthesis